MIIYLDEATPDNVYEIPTTRLAMPIKEAVTVNYVGDVKHYQHNPQYELHLVWIPKSEVEQWRDPHVGR